MKHFFSILFCLCSCLLLSGCSWKDAGDLTAVTAGTISRTKDGYALTAELAIPDSEAAAPSAKQVSGSAPDIPQAIDNTGYGLDAQLYWSHARVLFLDSTLLESGIGDCVRQLTASSEVRPAVRLCALRGKEDILGCEAISGEPIGFAFGDSISYAVEQSQTPDMPLYQVLDRIQSNGMDAVMPAATVKDGQAVLSGCALFSNDTLCGWLNDRQTGILSLLLAKGDKAVFYADHTRYLLTNIRTKITANTKKNLAYTISLQADLACESDDVLQPVSAALKQQCMAVIDTLQHTGCDALGLGRAWEREDPDSRNKANAMNWQTAPVTVKLTLHPVQSAEGGSR